MISAHYGLSDVFDNLIISLCKFTALSSEVSSDRNCVLGIPKEDLSLCHRSTLIYGADSLQHILSLSQTTEELRPFLSDIPCDENSITSYNGDERGDTVVEKALARLALLTNIMGD